MTNKIIPSTIKSSQHDYDNTILKPSKIRILFILKDITSIKHILYIENIIKDLCPDKEFIFNKMTNDNFLLAEKFDFVHIDLKRKYVGMWLLNKINNNKFGIIM